MTLVWDQAQNRTGDLWIGGWVLSHLANSPFTSPYLFTLSYIHLYSYTGYTIFTLSYIHLYSNTGYTMLPVQAAQCPRCLAACLITRPTWTPRRPTCSRCLMAWWLAWTTCVRWDWDRVGSTADPVLPSLSQPLPYYVSCLYLNFYCWNKLKIVYSNI